MYTFKLFFRVVSDVLACSDNPSGIRLEKSHQYLHTDFPTPLRPITQSVSPRITAKLTRSRAKFDPKDFDTYLSAKKVGTCHKRRQPAGRSFRNLVIFANSVGWLP